MTRVSGNVSPVFSSVSHAQVSVHSRPIHCSLAPPSPNPQPPTPYLEYPYPLSRVHSSPKPPHLLHESPPPSNPHPPFPQPTTQSAPHPPPPNSYIPPTSTKPSPPASATYCGAINSAVMPVQPCFSLASYSASILARTSASCWMRLRWTWCLK